MLKITINYYESLNLVFFTGNYLFGKKINYYYNLKSAKTTYTRCLYIIEF